VIAGLTNITTVTNFRQADHTFGGNAAPLMQYLDFILFRSLGRPIMTLNIGGIANVHYVCNNRQEIMAFDTGPGNLISNLFATFLYDLPCDYNGNYALSGNVNKNMLAEFMDHPFFKRSVPRSGWKIDFSNDYCREMLDKHKELSSEDLLASACAFTAQAIVQSLYDYIPSEKLNLVEVMYASGGGVKNRAIMREIAFRLPQNIRLAVSNEIGIPPEYKEAIKFATLAYSTIHKIANNIPAACHASQYTILGKISIAPWKARNIEPL
jgi:anhydro-N-acetylmuramic acid kinase